MCVCVEVVSVQQGRCFGEAGWLLETGRVKKTSMTA